jgi:hypothetical protein
MSKYNLLTVGEQRILLGPTSTKVVNSLKDAGTKGMTYADLGKQTKSPVNSLYVLGQRLRDAGIAKSITSKDGERTLALLTPKKIHIEAVTTLG